MELKEGQVYINSLGNEIEILGTHEKVVVYSVNKTVYWCTDYNSCIDIIRR